MRSPSGEAERHLVDVDLVAASLLPGATFESGSGPRCSARTCNRRCIADLAARPRRCRDTGQRQRARRSAPRALGRVGAAHAGARCAPAPCGAQSRCAAHRTVACRRSPRPLHAQRAQLQPQPPPPAPRPGARPPWRSGCARGASLRADPDPRPCRGARAPRAPTAARDGSVASRCRATRTAAERASAASTLRRRAATLTSRRPDDELLNRGAQRLTSPLRKPRCTRRITPLRSIRNEVGIVSTPNLVGQLALRVEERAGSRPGARDRNAARLRRVRSTFIASTGTPWPGTPCGAAPAAGSESAHGLHQDAQKSRYTTLPFSASESLARRPGVRLTAGRLRAALPSATAGWRCTRPSASASAALRQDPMRILVHLQLPAHPLALASRAPTTSARAPTTL